MRLMRTIAVDSTSTSGGKVLTPQVLVNAGTEGLTKDRRVPMAHSVMGLAVRIVDRRIGKRSEPAGKDSNRP